MPAPRALLNPKKDAAIPAAVWILEERAMLQGRRLSVSQMSVKLTDRQEILSPVAVDQDVSKQLDCICFGQ